MHPTAADPDRGDQSRVLRVAAVQAASSLDPADNRAALADLVPRALADGAADLVVFPEAFARDFGPAGSDVSPYAEQVDGPFGDALTEAARAAQTTVVAGMFEAGPDPERPFNTLLARGATSASYRKIHLYDSFGYRESDRLTGATSGRAVDPAADLTLVAVAGFTVGLMTCYDIRFPEHARSLVDRGAEVLVLPAAWVAGPRKVDHWRTLLRARAIENTVYVVAAAQPGPRYCGHSLIVDPLGDVLAEAGPGDGGGGPEIVRATLHADALAEARRANPSLANRRL